MTLRSISPKRAKPSGCYVGSEDYFQRTAINLVRSIAATQGVPKEAVMHVPNGGQRNAIVGAKLKGMGTVKGYPDIMVFHSTTHWPGGSDCYGERVHGLALELKVWPNKPSPEQHHVHDILRDAGWDVLVCYGLDEVERVTKEYFNTK